MGCLAVCLIFFQTFTLMLGTLINNRGGVIGLGLAFLFGQQFLADMLPVLWQVLPVGIFLPRGRPDPGPGSDARRATAISVPVALHGRLQHPVPGYRCVEIQAGGALGVEHMYDDFSEDYDRFVNWSGRLAYEMPFLEAALRRGRRAGLRLRDGDARHRPGAKGYASAGADLSPRMVERARANACKPGWWCASRPLASGSWRRPSACGASVPCCAWATRCRTF